MGAAASNLTSDGGTRLLKCIEEGNVQAVRDLIDAHPELLQYATYHSHLTCCHVAASTGAAAILQLLISRANHPLYSHSLPRQAVHRHRQSSAQLQLASQPGSRTWQDRSLAYKLVNARTNKCATPLMLAAEKGCCHSVRLLLQQGAEPWAVDSLGATALHYAAASDKADVLQLLLDAAGDMGPAQQPNSAHTRYVNLRTQIGLTAIHCAVRANAQQALAVLLTAGGNPSLASFHDCMAWNNLPKGSTALHLAARTANTAAAMLLLRAHAEQWQHRGLPDLRLLGDRNKQLPFQLALRQASNPAASDLAAKLTPSTPLAVLFAGEPGSTALQLGPSSLAILAGNVLRRKLYDDLAVLQATAEGAAAAAPSCSSSVPSCSSAGAAVANSSVAPAGNAATSASGRDAAACVRAKTHATQEAVAALEEPCGVCLDAVPKVMLCSCKHKLCKRCCSIMLGLNSRCVLMCPFCRAYVGSICAE